MTHWWRSLSPPPSPFSPHVASFSYPFMDVYFPHLHPDTSCASRSFLLSEVTKSNKNHPKIFSINGFSWSYETANQLLLTIFILMHNKLREKCNFFSLRSYKNRESFIESSWGKFGLPCTHWSALPLPSLLFSGFLYLSLSVSLSVSVSVSPPFKDEKFDITLRHTFHITNDSDLS